VTVSCRLDHSAQYQVTNMLCITRGDDFAFYQHKGAQDLGRYNGSIPFPHSVPGLYLEDYWSRGVFICVVKSSGRLQCLNGKTKHYFTAGAHFINIDS
jgi:hypothetical protein